MEDDNSIIINVGSYQTLAGSTWPQYVLRTCAGVSTKIHPSPSEQRPLIQHGNFGFVGFFVFFFLSFYSTATYSAQRSEDVRLWYVVHKVLVKCIR
jgi:hypothetical protein